MVALIVSIALTAVPGAAQTENQHDHTQEAEPSAEQNTMMHEMMMACPFLDTMGMSGEMMGMMGGGMMDHEMMSGMEGHEPGMAGRGMMGTGFPGPNQLIAQKDQLNLSEEQITKLQALQERVQKATRVHMDMSRGSQDRASEVLEQDPEGIDESSEKTRFPGTHLLEAHIVMIQAGFEAQKILTPEQKKAAARVPTNLHQSMKMGGMGMGTKMMNGKMIGGSGGMGSGTTPRLD
jgi:hypothetical protein